MTNITLGQAVMFTAKMAPESSATPMETRQVCIDTEDSLMSRGMRFPTIWHFDMSRLGRASASSF